MDSEHQIHLRFYAELNDFLPKELRKKEFSYNFFGSPSIKDIIEAIGVPHPEVDLILVNGQSVDFKYRIRSNDRISVYPVFELLDISPLLRLRPQPLREPKFILDINLGKLASELRMLGFDSLYQNNFADQTIIKIAEEQTRIILTRDIGLLKNSKVQRGYWIRASQPLKQMEEVIEKFDLYAKFKPFSVCLVCNGRISSVKKEQITDQLLPRTQTYYDDFYRCDECHKIYWKGSHYQKMWQKIEEIKERGRKR